MESPVQTQESEATAQAGPQISWALVLKVALAAAVAAGLYLVWLLPLESLSTACGTRRLTGVPCPTCGMGRSLHALLHGRVLDSLYYHPLVLPFLLSAAGWWAVVLRRRKAGLDVPLSTQWTACVVGVAILVVVWGIRLSLNAIP